MYLKRIYDENVGPIEKLDLELSFTERGNPKPTIFVGENGSGKSILLSNIVDAFYEISSVAYTDSKIRAESGETIYFKGLSATEIKIGESHLLSYLNFFDPEGMARGAESIFKLGALEKPEIEARIQQKLMGNFQLKGTNHYKKHSVSKEFASKMFGKEIICYFPPSRYAIPSWQNTAYSVEDNMSDSTLSNKEAGAIHNTITINGASKDNIAWLLDVIVDSRSEIISVIADILSEVVTNNPIKLGYNFKQILEMVDKPVRTQLGLAVAEHLGETFDQILVLQIARENTEALLSEILGEQVYFDLQPRNHFGSRFCIKRVKDNSIYVNNLNALSTGQLALLNMFLTIIRYSDRNNIGTSIQLAEIAGIVVIDEIELHLHSKLQREVLPKLIKLMPGVQFIITSHSPLFLLGMREEFGEDGFDMYEMPTGSKKNAEDFSEFQVAYDYMKQTTFHRNQIAEEISKYQEKTLVVTEGGSDWIHMKAAINYFTENEDFSGLDFTFFEFTSKKDCESGLPYHEMGDKTMISMCKQFSKIPQSRKIIFIADNDIEATMKEIRGDDTGYKSWGNNVYSLILPVPAHRDGCMFSIEHFYNDDEIKTEIEINGIPRRLFMRNEFSKKGYAKGKYSCVKAKNEPVDSIKIFDDNVDDINSDDINLALPKMKFAQNILNKVPPFDNFDFGSFRRLFEIIEEICTLP